uniref:Uncharacterized protein n=1 Tax=Anguilla anguilla TaxID=7936 RepID=A0A0E9X0V6_ANGAN
MSHRDGFPKKKGTTYVVRKLALFVYFTGSLAVIQQDIFLSRVTCYKKGSTATCCLLQLKEESHPMEMLLTCCWVKQYIKGHWYARSPHASFGSKTANCVFSVFVTCSRQVKDIGAHAAYLNCIQHN